MDKLPGGWKLKRLLLRLLKEHDVLLSAEEKPYLIEEAAEERSFRTIFLIQDGLLHKVWHCEEEASGQPLQEEIGELIRKPVIRSDDEGRIERLVIKHYLAEPRRNRRILHLNLLAGSDLNS